MSVCCVPGCGEKRCKNTTLYCFPNPKTDMNIFSIWLKRIENDKLFKLEFENVHRCYRVCHRHFDPFCSIPNMRKLKKGSLPTLNLPSFSESSTNNCNIRFLDPEAIKKQVNRKLDFGKLLGSRWVTEGIYAIPLDELSQKREPKNCEQSLELSNSRAGNLEASLSSIQSCVKNLNEPSCSHWTPTVSNTLDVLCKPSTTLEEKTIVQDTPITRKCFTQRIPFLKKLKVSKATQLTPKCRKLNQFLTQTKKIVRRLESRNVTLKQRVKSAERLANTDQFKHIMSKSAFSLFKLQIQTSKKKPRGRRFDLESKMICLSLLKNSNKGYNFLRKIFTLPSKRTLLSLLQKIHTI